MPKFGALDNRIIGSHTEDEWQTLVRRYGWRCFYCGSPMHAWRATDGRILQIRQRNADRPWESSGKVMSFVEASEIVPEHILTKDHLVPLFHGNVRVDSIWNLRPVDLHCNRLKGQKTVTRFMIERKGMIFQWINTLPSDDWRVREWEHWQASEGIERAASSRFLQSVDGEAQKPTGVFALAFDLASGVDVRGVKKGKDLSLPSPSRPRGHENCEDCEYYEQSFSTPRTPIEERDEPGILRRLTSERERVSWAWKNPA